LCDAAAKGRSGSRFRPGVLAVIAAVLGGCGFHLQGTHELPAPMARTYIQAPDQHSLFYRELRRRLVAAGVEVVENHGAASAVFDIRVDDTGQRVLSVSARNVPTEYEVYYTVHYGVSADGSPLVPDQDLTLTRDYTYDATLVLGKEREEDVLRQRLANDLVRIVMEQISVQ